MVDDFKHYFGTQIYLPLLKQANERLQRSDAPEAEAFRLSNQLQETLPRAQADQIMTIVDGFGLVTEDVALPFLPDRRALGRPSPAGGFVGSRDGSPLPSKNAKGTAPAACLRPVPVF